MTNQEAKTLELIKAAQTRGCSALTNRAGYNPNVNYTAVAFAKTSTAGTEKAFALIKSVQSAKPAKTQPWFDQPGAGQPKATSKPLSQTWPGKSPAVSDKLTPEGLKVLDEVIANLQAKRTIEEKRGDFALVEEISQLILQLLLRRKYGA